MSFSSRRRATAVKLKIGDSIAGEFVTNQDGSKALHVKTDDLIRRVRVMGEITSKVINEAEEMVIYDVTDKSSFGNVINWRNDLLEFSGDIPFIIIGNKIDLPNKEVPTEQLQDLANQLNAIKAFETSAKTGEGIEDAFNQLAIKTHEVTSK